MKKQTQKMIPRERDHWDDSKNRRNDCKSNKSTRTCNHHQQHGYTAEYSGATLMAHDVSQSN